MQSMKVIIDRNQYQSIIIDVMNEQSMKELFYIIIMIIIIVNCTFYSNLLKLIIYIMCLH